jgi:hypothetical protein
MMDILAETCDFKNFKILNFGFKNWQVFAHKTVNWSQLGTDKEELPFAFTR